MEVADQSPKCLLEKEYPFGCLQYFDTYVIDKLKSGLVITTDIATQILTDLNQHYKAAPIIYISHRLFTNAIDPSVYSLVDPNLIRGIAVVGQNDEIKTQALSEQSLYDGRFTFFPDLNHAVSWARSFSR